MRLRLSTLETRAVPAAFAEPTVISSTDGVLEVTLRAHQTTAVIELRQDDPTLPGIPTPVEGFLTYAWEVHAGTTSDGSTSGDAYPSPTLQVQRGDTLRIHLVNDMMDLSLPGYEPTEVPTNLHTHGLHVSPRGTSDNVLLNVMPGETVVYEYQIPDNHDEGVFWYHPHRHEFVDSQVYRGLAGLLVVGSRTHGIVEVEGKPVRMMIHQIQKIDTTGDAPKLVPYSAATDAGVQMTINGLYMPELQMEDTDEVWLQLHANPKDLLRTFIPPNPDDSTTWNFNDPANQLVHFIGQDGNAFPRTVEKPRTALAPGKRVEEVVTSPAPGADKLFVGTSLNPRPDLPALTQPILRIKPFTTAGDPNAWKNRPLESTTDTFDDLSQYPIDTRRQLTFSLDNSTGRPMFMIDGRVFPDTPVFQPRLGAVEEWVVTNRDPVPHPIHIHLQDFQAFDAATPHNFDQDTLYVEPYGVTVLRVRFRDYIGAAVYHCHNLVHEDGGMMAVINVIPQVPLAVVGADAGGGPRVRALNADTGEAVHDFLAFDAAFAGGVRVAQGDLNGDGVADVIAAAGPGGGPNVRAFDGRTGAKIADFFAFDPAFAGGVFVTAGDFDMDGVCDIVCAAGAGGGPNVRVYSGRGGMLIADFLAYSADFTGGVSVAAGDLDLNGRVELITGAGPGGGPHVLVYAATADTHAMGVMMTPVASFYAFAADATGGVSVAAARSAGSGRVELIAGAGVGAAPEVRVYTPMVHGLGGSGHGGEVEELAFDLRLNFLAADAGYRGGVRVGSRHHAGHDAILTTTAAGTEPVVTAFDAAGGHGGQPGSMSEEVFEPEFLGGVFVGNAGV